MRIISNYKDYYDSCMKQGMDRSIVYVRERKELGEPDKWYDYKQKLHKVIVGFCGKLYPGIYTWEHKDRDYPFSSNSSTKHVFYTLESLDKYIQENQNYFVEEDIFSRKEKHITAERYRRHFESRNDRDNNYDRNYQKIFLEHNIPTFTVDLTKNLTVINDCLKDWEFYKVFDAWQAYQEVFMYVGGVLLGNTKPIPEIDDVTLAEAKGFDKWSFRKEPSKKK